MIKNDNRYTDTINRSPDFSLVGLYNKEIKKMKGWSTKCGKGACPHYDANNQVSKCKIFDDRNLCSISNKSKHKVASKSRNKSNPFQNFT